MLDCRGVPVWDAERERERDGLSKCEREAQNNCVRLCGNRQAGRARHRQREGRRGSKGVTAGGRACARQVRMGL